MKLEIQKPGLETPRLTTCLLIPNLRILLGADKYLQDHLLSRSEVIVGISQGYSRLFGYIPYSESNISLFPELFEGGIEDNFPCFQGLGSLRAISEGIKCLVVFPQTESSGRRPVSSLLHFECNKRKY